MESDSPGVISNRRYTLHYQVIKCPQVKTGLKLMLAPGIEGGLGMAGRGSPGRGRGGEIEGGVL